MSQINHIVEPALDPARQEKAREYARIRRRLHIGELALNGVLLSLFSFTGVSQKITAQFDLPAIPLAVVYILILLVGYQIITTPLDYYSGFVLPHRYGLSRQNFRGWLGDALKGRGIGLLLAVGAVALVYWFLDAFPQVWWLLVWLTMLLFSLLATLLAPLLIIPLFIKMKPLQDAELKSRLEQLAQKAGVYVRGVYTMETSRKATTANAALMGLGHTRRIALTDTLMENYSPEEIEVILAHEMAHHRHGDIPRGFVIQSALMLAGFFFVDLIFSAVVEPSGYRGLADVAALPLLLLLAGALSLLISPLITTYQRRRESLADAFALELTRNPQAFIAMMTRLTDQNLAEAESPRWVEVLLHDHPNYQQRVALARRYQAAAGEDT